jgi:mutator protein MutT
MEDAGTKVSGLIHLIPETEEFYNKNHGRDGRFTSGSGGGAIRASESKGKNRSEEDELEDDLNKTFGKDTVKRIRAEGHDPKDYNFKDKDGKLTGKPLPGSDSWKKAHGIDKSVYEGRPTKRFSGPNDPIIDEVYKDVKDPSQKRFTKGKVANQSPGFIMVRKPLPGADDAGFGPIPPQARPDNKVVIDQRGRARKKNELAKAEKRVETLKDYTGQDIVAEREARVARLKKDLRQAKALDKADITAAPKAKLDKADKALKQAEKSGDEEAIGVAKRNRKIAESEYKEASKKGNLIDSGDRTRAARIIEQELSGAEKSLARAKADPDKALKNARESADNQVVRKQAALEKTAVKYAFPPGEGSASRMEAHQDPQNIKNLTEGKGRVYFVMEGQIKADAVLSQVKKEDPKAAVVSVPSVTAWNEKEVAWATDKYFKGRDVILIPDADGVSNDAVVKQAKTLQGRMLNGGAGSVTVASPPLVRNKRGGLEVEDIWYPTGVKDGRKGVDDHIGLGHGTLGDLTFNDSPRPKFDLSKETGTKKLRSNSVANAETTLEALSDLSGERGAGRISKKTIAKTTGLPESSVNDALKTLEKKGYIKRYDIFDQNALANGRREPTMEYDEIKRVTKKAGVKVPDLDTKFVFNDDIHETAPIYEIVDNRFISKTGPSKTLASQFKGLQQSDRIVRTPEGAARYGVPVGSPLPGAVVAGGFIQLATMVTPVAAGLGVVAEDTGRVLMLQRALDDDDPASGKWEFPGGHIDDGETPQAAAFREWTEEIGIKVPPGRTITEWAAPNGKYVLFVHTVAKEADVNINRDHEDRHILNPDDPDGDNIEVVAWWSLADLKDNPGLRDEVKETDWAIFESPGAMVATGFILRKVVTRSGID